MTKKEYQKPVMEVIEADIEQQILAVSVTNLTIINTNFPVFLQIERDFFVPLQVKYWFY